MSKRWYYFVLIKICLIFRECSATWGRFVGRNFHFSVIETESNSSLLRATRRGDMLLRHVASCDMVHSCDKPVAATKFCLCDVSHEFKLFWIRATHRSDKMSDSSVVAACVHVCDKSLRQVAASNYKLTNERESCIFAILNWKTSSHSHTSKFAVCAPNKHLVAATCF